MENFIQIIIELLLITSFLHKSCSTKLDGCHIDDKYVAICTSIPECNESSYEYLKQIRKFVFYNELSKIEANSFSNCKFNNQLDTIEIIFNSLTEIQDFSFLNMDIESNTKVTLIINGDSDTQELEIHPNAFKGINLSRNSIFLIEISNYKQINIESALVEDIVQDENSIVNFIFKTNYQILFLNNSQTDLNPSKLTKNITFKIEIMNSNRVFIEEDKFKFLTIDALSEFLFIISDTSEIFFGKNCFSSITISFKAKFSVYVKKANNVLLGDGLFQNLIQEDYSLFYFIIQNLENNFDETNSICFLVPESFMKNIKQNRYSLLQIHFIDFRTHFITFSQKALDEIFLNDESTVQFYFKDIDTDIIFLNESINHLQLTNGIFEVTIENHASKVYSINSTKPVYFIFNSNAAKSIYLTSKSTFKIGFHNSSSIFNLNEASLNEVHVDDFVDEQPDYRTKLTVEVKNSPNFRMKFSNIINSKAKIPLLIEIDNYMPLLSIVNSDGTFEVDKTLNANKNSYNRKYTENINNLLQYELCQYSSLKGYLEDHMIYFSEPKNENLRLKQNQMCSSCLFLYLYRYVHRHQDFYYRRDQLPDCFTNLLYKDTFAFNDKAYMLIDDKINKYWSLQRCGIISGMRSTNDSKSEMLLEKNICSKYFVDKPFEVNTKCYSTDVSQIKKTINLKTNVIKKPNKQSSLSNILTLIVVLIISILCIVVILNAILKRHYCKKPCFHVNVRRKNNSKFFKILTKLSDDAFTNENEDNDDENTNDVEYERGGSNGANESITLCKFNSDGANVKKLIQNKTKSIFKAATESKSRKMNNYQTIFDEDDLGKYETLSQNDESINGKIKKSVVNVLYNVSKNKTSLSKTDDNCDEQEDCIFDDSIRLKTNPMHDMNIKNKPVNV